MTLPDLDRLRQVVECPVGVRLRCDRLAPGPDDARPDPLGEVRLEAGEVAPFRDGSILLVPHLESRPHVLRQFDARPHARGDLETGELAQEPLERLGEGHITRRAGGEE